VINIAFQKLISLKVKKFNLPLDKLIYLDILISRMKRYLINLPEDLWQWLREYAFQQERSISEIVRKVLTAFKDSQK
jgi:hypothetical protein